MTTMREFIKKHIIINNGKSVNCGVQAPVGFGNCNECPIYNNFKSGERCKDVYLRYKLKYEKLDKLKEILK